MIKGIALRKVELSEEEFGCYQELVKVRGDSVFNDLFNTDERGIITIITPSANTTMDVLYFIQNLSINQHLREQDRFLDVLGDKVRRLEERLGLVEKDNEVKE
jgi:hypothetical protein